jgi:NTP pyrophosphatase (non-canonical NTP hydrolase)
MSIFIQNSPLSLAQMQQFHAAFDEEKQFDKDIIRNVAYLAEEVGELSAAIRHLLNQLDEPSQQAARQGVGSELADCLAYLCKLANLNDIDLESAYRQKMKRNMERTWTRPADMGNGQKEKTR